MRWLYLGLMSLLCWTAVAVAQTPRVSLTWSWFGVEPGVSATYQIEVWRTQAGGTPVLLATLPAATTTYGDAALVPGEEHCYWVIGALNGQHTAPSNHACVTPPAPPAPAPPPLAGTARVITIIVQ